MTVLGEFTRVRDIKTVWANEAYDFTPWLATRIDILSDALGLGPEGLAVQGVEVPVGAYFADIVCTDLTRETDELVIIENQYGRSDHDHFGKMLTYASGLKAATVVLLCERLRAEHRTALTWLNSISNDDHRFFGVELELWRIGDSPIAPRFNIVVEPDDWARQAEESKRAEVKGELTDLKKLYVRYWAALGDAISNADDQLGADALRPRKPLPQQWMGFAIGRSAFELSAALNSQDNWIRVELALHGAKARQRREDLLEAQADIEQELGYPLDWQELSGSQQRISVVRRGVDPTDESDWPSQHDWFRRHLNDFQRVFRQRVKALD